MQLGATGLEITRVGFGAWVIGGGGWEFGWGSQEDEESIAAIHRALDPVLTAASIELTGDDIDEIEARTR